MNWYIGQEIVCIDSKGTTRLKEGETYVIKGLMQGCCSISIDVGIRDFSTTIRCSICSGIVARNTVIEWKASYRFAPLMDISELESILKQEPKKEKA